MVNLPKIPSELLEPIIANIIGEYWEDVEFHLKSQESLKKMYDDLQVLCNFASKCGAAHCKYAIINMQYFLYCLMEDCKKAKLRAYYKAWYKKNGRKRKPTNPCPKCGGQTKSVRVRKCPKCDK